jgi:hypothetical protein
MGALGSLEDLEDGLTASDLKRGSMLANGGMEISGEGAIVGDLNFGRSLSLRGVTHEGAKRQLGSAEEVPKVRIQDYEPRGPEIIDFSNRPPSSSATLSVSGLAKYESPDGRPLKLNKGLKLDGGVLYVKGDLEVEGGVSGTGAVFCTGKLTVKGGEAPSALKTDALCALVSGGDMFVSGAGSAESSFHGLVYSGGNVKVQDITVVGAVVGSKEGGEMEVARANLVFDPKAVNFKTEVGYSVDTNFNGVIGVALKPDHGISPSALYRPQGQPKYPMPDDTTIQAALVFQVGQEKGLSYEEALAREARANVKFQDVKATIAARLDELERKGSPPRDSGLYLDLNRFVRLQSKLRIISRRLERL